MTEPLAVGLVGAGHWASVMHAPTLAAGPETRLAAVWGRSFSSVSALASAYGAVPAASFAELLDHCSAVAFAVPPDVQAPLAVEAARAGRHVLLEKPIALSMDDALDLTAAVDHAGVVSQLVLTKRYQPETRSFVESAAKLEPIGARSCYLHGGFLGGVFAAGWRMTYGALYDLGPHLLDLLDATVGPIVDVSARGDLRRWVELTCVHSSGAISQGSLSGCVDLGGGVLTRVELYGTDGMLEFDTTGTDPREAWPVIRREFASSVAAGVPHELDVHRGLMLQRLLARAAAHLR